MKYTGKYSDEIRNIRRFRMAVLIAGVLLIAFFIVFSQWRITVLDDEYTFGFIPNGWAMFGCFTVWFIMLVLLLYSSVRVVNIRNNECDPDRYITVFENAALKKPNAKSAAVIKARMYASFDLGRFSDAAALAGALTATTLRIDGFFVIALVAYLQNDRQTLDAQFEAFETACSFLGKGAKKHALKREILTMLHELSAGRADEALAHAEAIRPKNYIPVDTVFCSWIRARVYQELGKTVDAIGCYKTVCDLGGKTYYKADACRRLEVILETGPADGGIRRAGEESEQ
ncbi:MAG: hypothetical protein IJU52_01125 [Clostridia bacterium]|nr:hypothetical protein [Clostridia bacterium]